MFVQGYADCLCAPSSPMGRGFAGFDAAPKFQPDYLGNPFLYQPTCDDDYVQAALTLLRAGFTRNETLEKIRPMVKEYRGPGTADFAVDAVWFAADQCGLPKGLTRREIEGAFEECTGKYMNTSWGANEDVFAHCAKLRDQLLQRGENAALVNEIYANHVAEVQAAIKADQAATAAFIAKFHAEQAQRDIDQPARRQSAINAIADYIVNQVRQGGTVEEAVQVAVQYGNPPEYINAGVKMAQAALASDNAQANLQQATEQAAAAAAAASQAALVAANSANEHAAADAAAKASIAAAIAAANAASAVRKTYTDKQVYDAIMQSVQQGYNIEESIMGAISNFEVPEEQAQAQGALVKAKLDADAAALALARAQQAAVRAAQAKAEEAAQQAAQEAARRAAKEADRAAEEAARRAVEEVRLRPDEGYADTYLADVIKESMQQGFTLQQSAQALLERGVSQVQLDRVMQLLQPATTGRGTPITTTPAASTASSTPLLLAAAAAYLLGA